MMPLSCLLILMLMHFQVMALPLQSQQQESQLFILKTDPQGQPLTGANQFAPPKPGTAIWDGSALGSYNGGNGGYGGPDGNMNQPNQPPPQEYGSGLSIPCPICIFDGK